MDDPFRPTKTISSSEDEFETDIESTTRPVEFTIAEAISAKSKGPCLDISDSGSTISPTALRSPAKNTTLRPSGRALIKEFFAESEPFNLPKGHPVIAFTEDQISSVLKVVAEETARSIQDAMEKLISQVSALSVAPVSSQVQTAGKTPGSGKRYRGSIGSGRYSDTSGALQSDDEFSSIGYSFEDSKPSRIADPPRAGTVAERSHDGQTVSPSVFEVRSPGDQTQAAVKAEAIEDKEKRFRNK